MYFMAGIDLVEQNNPRLCVIIQIRSGTINYQRNILKIICNKKNGCKYFIAICTGIQSQLCIPAEGGSSKPVGGLRGQDAHIHPLACVIQIFPRPEISPVEDYFKVLACFVYYFSHYSRCNL